MSVRWIAWCLSIACCLVLGCGKKAEPPKAAQSTEVTHEPGVIEIRKVDVAVSDEQVATFRIHYKFTSGKPNKFYMCNLVFPGNEKKGMKPLDAWEMKPEGNVLTRLEIDDSINEFTIQFSEADSPDKGYTANSNTFAGKVFPDKQSQAKATDAGGASPEITPNESSEAPPKPSN